jgi:hypothetical protein
MGLVLHDVNEADDEYNVMVPGQSILVVTRNDDGAIHYCVKYRRTGSEDSRHARCVFGVFGVENEERPDIARLTCRQNGVSDAGERMGSSVSFGSCTRYVRPCMV